MYLALSVSKKQIVVSIKPKPKLHCGPLAGVPSGVGPNIEEAREAGMQFPGRCGLPSRSAWGDPAAGAESLARAPGSPGFWVPRRPWPHLLVQLPELGWETGVRSCPVLLQVSARLEPEEHQRGPARFQNRGLPFCSRRGRGKEIPFTWPCRRRRPRLP